MRQSIQTKNTIKCCFVKGGSLSTRACSRPTFHEQNMLDQQSMDVVQRELAISATYSSASDVRRKRKISKVKTKKKTQQDDIAEAVIRGDIQKIEDIIDVLDTLHGRGINCVLSYRYSYNPDTGVVETAGEDSNLVKTAEEQYRNFLNIIHLACIFDQEQVIEFLALYGHNNMKQRLVIKD